LWGEPLGWDSSECHTLPLVEFAYSNNFFSCDNRLGW